MDLSKIISITGRTGLYRIVAQGRQALIAESLEDGKRIPVHASVRVSTLEEISMFTKGDDVPLGQVFTKLYEIDKGKLTVDPKGDIEALYGKLGEALPDHDRSRIYSSDVRKFFFWFGQLLKAGALKEEAKEKKGEKAGAEKAKDAEPVKKAASKAKAPAKAAAKSAAPKPTAGSKAKSTPVRKSAQRGA